VLTGGKNDRQGKKRCGNMGGGKGVWGGGGPGGGTEGRGSQRWRHLVRKHTRIDRNDYRLKRMVRKKKLTPRTLQPKRRGGDGRGGRVLYLQTGVEKRKAMLTKNGEEKIAGTTEEKPRITTPKRGFQREEEGERTVGRRRGGLGGGGLRLGQIVSGSQKKKKGAPTHMGARWFNGEGKHRPPEKNCEDLEGFPGCRGREEKKMGFSGGSPKRWVGDQGG